MIEVLSYLTGFADGEGCFCVSFNRSARHKFGWEIRPSFSVSQNEERSQVLHLYRKHFECGSIRPDRSDKTLKFEVRSVNDLVLKVIPHFIKYPLLSGKLKEFERFKRVVELMNEGKHLAREGFEEVVLLAGNLNADGKKKYRRDTIKI